MGYFKFFKSLFNPVHGLVEANVGAYFVARVTGEDHRDALIQMIETRYRFPRDDYKRSSALGQLRECADLEAENQLSAVISTMHREEVNLTADTFAMMKVRQDIEDTIAKYQRKYPNVEL